MGSMGQWVVAAALLAASSRGDASPAQHATRNGQHAASPSFAEFDRRARAGERLSVVFFGASLTWGANASEPNQTSYRGQMARRLEEAYPRAHFHFWDAAIGGTGSQLGVFRLQRDVLARKPDLVFLDFTANDDITSDRAETLASYEALVRRILLEGHSPVVQVLFPFEWNVQQGNTGGMKRLAAHLAIAKAYHTAAGDAVSLAIRRVKEGKTTLKRLWPADGVHPCEEGYALFADAAWEAFQGAVKRKLVCAPPAKVLYADTYMHSARVRLSTLAPLPAGWHVGRPNLSSAFYDMLMCRWLDDETIAAGKGGAAVEPLKVRFRGAMVMLFGESTPRSGKYRVTIDGKVVEHRDSDKEPPKQEFDPGAFGTRCGGNVHLTQVIAEGLDPAVEHTMEIQPLFAGDAEQELRLESICVAGGEAWVAR